MLAGDNAKQWNCGKAGTREGGDTWRAPRDDTASLSSVLVRERDDESEERDGYGTVKGKGGTGYRVGRWDCM